MVGLTAQSIVDYLDNCVIVNHPGWFFMDLGHGYFYTANSRLSLFGDGTDWAIVFEEIETEFEEISSDARQVKLRGEYVLLPETFEGYKKWVPELDHVPRFDDLARYLAFEYEEACRATMDELRTCLPEALPFLMHVDAWHQRDYYYFVNGPEKPQLLGDKPSSYETFPMIAEVLAHRDPSRYRPTLPANNHWKHWPDAGGL